jgi:hypothetical protein
VLTRKRKTRLHRLIVLVYPLHRQWLAKQGWFHSTFLDIYPVLSFIGDGPFFWISQCHSPHLPYLSYLIISFSEQGVRTGIEIMASRTGRPVSGWTLSWERAYRRLKRPFSLCISARGKREHTAGICGYDELLKQPNEAIRYYHTHSTSSLLTCYSSSSSCPVTPRAQCIRNTMLGRCKPRLVVPPLWARTPKDALTVGCLDCRCAAR